MKFSVVAALMGMTQSVNINEGMKVRILLADKMKDICLGQGINEISKPESDTSLV